MEYSVIIPIFNSYKSIEELFERIVFSFQHVEGDFELIFVDDNSKDNSWEILKKIKNNSKFNIKIIRLSRNFGQHNATVCGIRESKGNIIITIDDDLEQPPESIPDLINEFKIKDYDLLYGIPNKDKKPIFRKLTSYFWRKFSKITAQGFGDGSSLRVMKKILADNLKRHNESFIYIDSVLPWYTDNFGVKKINYNARKFGNSNYSKSKLANLQIDIIVVYSALPLRLMIYGGFIVSFLSFWLGIWFIFKKIFIGTPQGYTSLVVLILF